MALCAPFGNRQGWGDHNGMSVTGCVEKIELTTHEPSSKLGNTPEERFIARVLAATSAEQAGAVVRMGKSKGWRFRCLVGFVVKLWAPPTGKVATTYTVTNATLWRAIKNRGLSLT